MSSEEDGKLVERKKDDPVHPSLMRAWRECRKNYAHLFEKGVRVWQQPAAYMDEVICSWLSELLEEEFPSGCLHSVDMFSGEHTETVLGKNYVRKQVKHLIGPHVTRNWAMTGSV